MRQNFDHIEKFRELTGAYAFKKGDPYGMFFFPYKIGRPALKVLCGPRGAEWEHISVSLPTRTPFWEEMCYIKKLFFEDEECVLQIHPPKSEYVNNHPFCLHLWRCTNFELPRPPSNLVGIKELGVLK